MPALELQSVNGCQPSGFTILYIARDCTVLCILAAVDTAGSPSPALQDTPGLSSDGL